MSLGKLLQLLQSKYQAAPEPQATREASLPGLDLEIMLLECGIRVERHRIQEVLSSV